jgi:hypothetical protein
MMDYLNHNAGAVQVVLTAIYVIATICMLISMLHGNKLVRENVRLITKMETERLRPLVYFDLVADGAVEAIVKNIGATAAYDIKIDLSPKIKTDDRLRNGELSLTTSTIAFLPPQREIEEYVEGFWQLLQQHPELKFGGKIKYRNAAQQWYEEEIHIDLSVHKARLQVAKKEVADEIAKANDVLKDISSTLQKLQRT